MDQIHRQVRFWSSLGIAILSVWLFCAPLAGDTVPGPDWYVLNAEIIAIVRAPDAPQNARPSEAQTQEVNVIEVLKGVWFASKVTLHGTKLRDGQAGILLVPYEEPLRYYPPPVAGSDPPDRRLVWPIGQFGAVETTLRFETTLKVETIKDYIAQSSPEQAGLSQEVLNSVLFPEKMNELRRRDPKRARYVAMTSAILDIQRDAGVVDSLLESSDPKIRHAAERRLVRPVAAPVRSWPEIPKLGDMPSDLGPVRLIDSLRKSDEREFAIAFRNWLDSGAIRDRSILSACGLNTSLMLDAHLQYACGGSGPYMPPAPRLPQRLLLDENLAPLDRFYAIALFVAIRDSRRFAAELAQANRYLQTSEPCSEAVRRAVFWEPSNSTASIAITRLVTCPDEDAGSLLLARYLGSKTGEGFWEITVRVKARDQQLANKLLAIAAKPCGDHNALWASRILAVGADIQVVPVLLKWLDSPDPECRQHAGWNLVQIPRESEVSRLIEAIATEENTSARESELVALGEIGSPESLHALISAAKEPLSDGTLIAVVRGLARIHDPRALETLAAIAMRADNSLGVASESVNAFGFVSGLYKGYPPAPVGSSGSADPTKVQEFRRLIVEWQQSRR
jgi:hypothetical protein